MSERNHVGSSSRLWAALFALVLGSTLLAVHPVLAASAAESGEALFTPMAGLFSSDEECVPSPETCNGVDDDCNGVVDDVVDPDPVDGINNDGDFQDGTPLIDEGFGFCNLSESAGAEGVCVTAGRLVCSGGALTCSMIPGNAIVEYEDEGPGGTCSDGADNDCDGLVDLVDPSCFTPEVCDGLDNDGDGTIDNGFPVGQACSSDGVGACSSQGVFYCNAAGTGVECSAQNKLPSNEGAPFGNTCGDGIDNNCDGNVDLDDAACLGFGVVELCNGLDDDFDGKVDEGFLLGAPCSEGLGVCTNYGSTVCSADGTTTACSVTAGPPQTGFESGDGCFDFADNDCDGVIDAQDADCAPDYADLGVTCSLAYDRGKPGADCSGWHVVAFDGGASDEVQADLLALDTDGTLLATIENVQPGELAHLASRQAPYDFKVSSKTNRQGTRHTMFAPMPILRVTGTRNGVEDVAYCSILPYLELTEPDGVTISLSDTSEVDVNAFIPLTDVDTLSIALDGVDIVQALGIDPAAAFPTGTGALCQNPGECIVQIQAGCGEMTLVPVEITDLKVEGLDTQLAATAKDGSEVPDQVNTVSFHLKGLPPGGHVVYLDGDPLPLNKRHSAQCVLDDLADTGQMSAFGVAVSSPFDQQVVTAGPVDVEGKVCGGSEIEALAINGLDVDVSGQICTTGDGVSSSDECYLDFSVPVPEKDLQLAAQASGHTGAFKRGSNRVIADASDVLGNRTFNTDVIFGLGDVQSPLGPSAMALEMSAQNAIRAAMFDIQMAMTTEIDPAFVVGLKEEAVQEFFSVKCPAAIADFTSKATASLQNADLGTVEIDPDCSCKVTATVVLEDLDFDNSVTGCSVDFNSGQIDVSVMLPNIRVQVGAHNSCTDHGIFGECIARTKLDVTAVTKLEDIQFDFAITETQIETKTPPDPNAFTFAFAIKDNDDNLLYASNGACSGGVREGNDCINDAMCGEGGTCVGLPPKNDAFDPVTSQGSDIECWGAEICTFFEAVGAVFITVFTFGIVDGFEVIDFLDFDVEVNKDVFDALKVEEPDPLELDEIEVDEGTVQDAGHASFTPGPIDVEIEDGGLTAAFGAEFTVQSVDPTIPETPGAALTPASVPTVSHVITTGNDVTMLVADDVFAQIFAAMKISGALQSTCTPIDGLTLDDLLPAEMDGGCESVGPDNIAGATLRGLCHAIRGADCSTLPPEGGGLKDDTKQGVCVGFQGGDCSLLPFGPKQVCNATPYRDIEATDGVLACARQDMEPDLLIKDDTTADNSVETQLLLEDLNVVFALDRNNDGAYNGTLEALPNCLSGEANGAGDCKVIASCLDLTITANMSVDQSQCTPDEAGFVFSNLMIVEPASNIDFGVMCGSSTGTSDEIALLQSFESKVIDVVNQAAESFTPPICVEGLTLGGVLNFSSDEAKVFGLTTDGATPGFSDYLGITVPLEP